MGRYVELRVTEAGEEILVYALKNVSEAAAMISFFDGMLSAPSFVVQPLLH